MPGEDPYAPPNAASDAPLPRRERRRLTGQQWIAVVVISCILGIASAFFPIFLPILWLLIAAIVVREMYRPAEDKRFETGKTVAFAAGCSLVGYVVYVPVCFGLSVVILPGRSNLAMIGYGLANILGFFVAMLAIIGIGAAVFGRETYDPALESPEGEPRAGGPPIAPRRDVEPSRTQDEPSGNEDGPSRTEDER